MHVPLDLVTHAILPATHAGGQWRTVRSCGELRAGAELVEGLTKSALGSRRERRVRGEWTVDLAESVTHGILPVWRCVPEKRLIRLDIGGIRNPSFTPLEVDLVSYQIDLAERGGKARPLPYPRITAEADTHSIHQGNVSTAPCLDDLLVRPAPRSRE